MLPWSFLVYTSEICFLTHVPLLVGAPRGLLKHALCIVRLAIHTSIFGILFFGSRTVRSGTTADHNAREAWVGETFSHILATPPGRAIPWLILTSFVMWVIACWHHQRSAISFSPHVWGIAHGPVNLLLCIPSVAAGDPWMAALGAAVNIGAAATIVIMWVMVKPIYMCYAGQLEWPDYMRLDNGCSETYYGYDSQRALGPASDQAGNIDGSQEQKYNNAQFRVTSVAAIIIAVVVMVWTVGPYQARKQARIANAVRKHD